MKKFFVFLLVAILHALTPQDILKQIPKNSPNYSFAKILIIKIDTLKPQKIVVNLNPKNEKEYINSFLSLINMYSLEDELAKDIQDLSDKTSILQNKKDPIFELQYIYFQKLLEIKRKELNYIQDNFKKFEKTIFEKIGSISFNVKKARDNIQVFFENLENLKRKNEELKINLQKYQLLNDEKSINFITQLIKRNLNEQKKIYSQLFNNQLVIWLNDIKNKDKKAFEDDDNLLLFSQKIDNEFYKGTNKVVSDFEKFAFGAKFIVYGAKKEIEILWENLLYYLNYPLFKVGNRTITPLNFAIFVLVLIIGWFAGKYYKKFIYKLRHKYKLSYSTATLLANMGYYAIIVTSFLIALKVIGLDLSSLAIIAGALSVGIGFGLQNVVSNFVSGIILMFERSIKVGDYIQIDQDTRGEIIDISMRSTVIRTNDNINLIIPNQSFIQNNVINWTLGDDIVRFRVPFGVAYGSDIDEVEKVVLKALEKSNLPHIKKHPTLDVKPLVVFMEMGDSSLNFELFVWVKGEYARRPRRTRSMFLKMIYNALNEAGINIPFPQQDLHIKDSVPLEIRLKS